jgi:hypothetical protein
MLDEKRGLWDNIHAKRERIKHGSGEHMRKPGSKGAPTDSAIKAASESVINPAHTKSKHFKTGETVELQSINPNDPDSRFDATDSAVRVYKNATPGQSSTLKTIKKVVKEALEEDWSATKYKNPEGGLTKAGVMAYRREHPGSHLQTAVTTKPSKLKAVSKAANRRKSFCARMSGMKRRLTSAKTAHDPNSRINKSLRKWNC